MKLYSKRPISITECRRLRRWLKLDNFAAVARQEKVTSPAVKYMVMRAITHILDHSDQHDNAFAREFPLVWARDNKEELISHLDKIKLILANDISTYNQSVAAIRRLKVKKANET